MRWKLYAIDVSNGVLESPTGEQIEVSISPLTRMVFVPRESYDKGHGLPPDAADKPTNERTNPWSDPWPLLPERTPDELANDRNDLKELVYELNADTAMDQVDTGIEKPYFTHGPREPEREIKRKK